MRRPTPSLAPSSKLPCKTCPWRRDQGAADIPNFDIELARRLACTCPDNRNMGPDWGAPMFACHQSDEGREVVCRGWLAQVGHAHPVIRLEISQGRLEPALLSPAEDWPALHETYPEVLAKLEAGCANPRPQAANDTGEPS